MRYGRLFGIFVLAAAAVVDGARADGFRTPSDNIHCLAEEWQGEAWLRCDIRASTAPAPPRPADCELDWGHAFTVSEDALPATPACAGDTVLDPSYPILHYGSKWEQHGFVCSVETDGVTCRNAHGNGFSLSKKQQTLN